MKQANLRSLPTFDLEHVARLTEGLWERHANAHVFMTGGTGFFGKWLQATFAGARMTVLTRNVDRARRESIHPHVEFVEGDIRDFAFPSSRFTHVIHAATPVQGLWKPESSLETLDMTFFGTRRVLELASRSNARLLLVSSGAVYGPQPPNLNAIPETFFGGPDSASPRMAYSEGKRAAEALTHIYGKTRSFDHVIARCFAFLGPHLPLHGNFAAGDFLKSALSGAPIEIKGSGEDKRSYLHPADLSIWLWTLLFRGKSGEIYNVGSDQIITIADLARRIAYHGSSQVMTKGSIELNPPISYVPDVSKAKRELGLQVRIGLDDAISRTFDWLKAKE